MERSSGKMAKLLLWKGRISRPLISLKIRGIFSLKVFPPPSRGRFEQAYLVPFPLR